MDEIARLLSANAGVVSTAQLLGAGMTRRRVRLLPGEGWRSPRHGWHACPNADPTVESTVHLGGVVACISALERHGVWVPVHQRHIRYSAFSSRPTGLGCRPYRHNPPTRSSIDDLQVAFDTAVNCLGVEDLIVIADSILNQNMLTLADIRTSFVHSPHRHRHLDARCDEASESGIETMTRCRLIAMRIKVRTQVEVPGIGRVDLLVGKRLIIECDGERHHRDKFQADRTRDRLLIGLGFIVVRLTYDDVVLTWKESVQDILAVIRRRDHERPAQILV